MADPRFFSNHGPFMLSALAEATGSELSGEDREILDVATLADANIHQLSFLDNVKYKNDFTATKAGGCFVHPKHQAIAPEGTSLLLNEDPYRAYAKAAQLFYPLPRAEEAQIAATAYVDSTATVGKGCIIEHGAYIGAGVELGEHCLIGPNAVLTHCIIGSHVIIHRGVAIGQDGFGFAMGPQGHEKLPQLGRVLVGDHVEIGANSCVDRGTGPDTVIGAGTKIDNLVQIGHNVQTGQACVIVAHAGISGSTKLGHGVVVAGQAGIAGHLHIQDGAQIAAQAGVMQNVAAGTAVGGSPAQPVKDWHRQTIALKRLTSKKKEA